MTAEERATPPAALSAAARSRIAEAAGVPVSSVGEALGKFEWTRAAMARMAQLKAEGKPLPTSFDDLEVRAPGRQRCPPAPAHQTRLQSSLGGGWRQQASAAATAAATGVLPPRAASPAAAAAAAGVGTRVTPTRMMHGRPVTAAVTPQLPKGVTRNGPCPCGSGNKYQRCCGEAAKR